MESSLRILLFLVLLVSTSQSNSTWGRRRCSNAFINQVRIENVTHKYESQVIDQPTFTDVQLRLNVSWEVGNIAEGVSLDGFLIRLTYVFDDERSILPNNICYPGNNKFWVRASNTSSCSSASGSCDQSLPSTSSDMVTCLCEGGNCSLLYDGGAAMCKGTDFWLTRNYFAIQADVRNLIFDVAFRQAYSFNVVPYYREFAGFGLHSHSYIPANVNCIDSVIQSSTRNELEATDICCDLGIPHSLARNVTAEEPVPDFKRDFVSVTVSWLPPVSQHNLTGFKCFPATTTPTEHFPTSTNPVKVNLTQSPVTSSCDDATYCFHSTLNHLAPGAVYMVFLTPEYDHEQMVEYGCYDGSCSTRYQFTVPEINSCDWNYCHPAASCRPVDDTGATTMKAKCECGPGYEGDGINTLWDETATGCKDADFCAEPRNSSCASGAICKDKPAPELGTNCACPDGYYGDGYVDGGGCTHNSVLGLKIGLPVTVVLVAIFIGLAWKMRVREIYKKKFRFSKFQSSGDKLANSKRDPEVSTSNSVPFEVTV